MRRQRDRDRERGRDGGEKLKGTSNIRKERAGGTRQKEIMKLPENRRER